MLPLHVSLLLLLLLLVVHSSGLNADDDPCWEPAKIVPGYCPKGRACQSFKKNVDHENVTWIGCPKGFRMRIKLADVDNEKDFRSVVDLTCRVDPPVYADERGNDLPVGASIYCIKKLPPTPRPALPTPPSLYASVAGGVVCIALGIVAVVVLLKFLRKRIKKSAPDFSSSSTEMSSQSSAAASYVAAPPVDATLPHRPPQRVAPRAPDGPKGAWLKRDRGTKRRRLDRAFFTRFSDAQLGTDVLPNFAHLPLKDRKQVLYTLTSLQAYAARMGDRKAYGHLHHFFELLRHAEAAQMDSAFTWESIFRFVRLLESLVKKHVPGDTLNIVDRMRSVMRAFARPIFDDLGWKMAPDEDATDTRMRFLVVRVLLWAEAPDVIEELTRQADIPADQLESPLRAVVFAFAARHLKRGEDLKKKHWKNVLSDPKAGDADKFGTLRQHLLFGLTAYRDEKAAAGTEPEHKFAKDILLSLYDFDNLADSFTPADQYWAYLGATEYATNVPAALAVYGSLSTAKLEMDKVLPVQLERKTAKKHPEEVDKIKEEWKHWIVDTMDMLAECAATKKQYLELSKTIMRYEAYLDAAELDCTHDNVMFAHRCSHVERLFSAKSVADIFNFALKKIEPGGAGPAQDIPPTQSKSGQGTLPTQTRSAQDKPPTESKSAQDKPPAL